MNEKLLITIWRDQVAPRFDLTSEVLVATVDSTGEVVHCKTVVLPTVSAEDLCHMILTEGITMVICGGIEEEYFQYLTWKKVRVIDSVIAPYDRALEFARGGRLEPGAILSEEASKG
jgi:predicted Fe-Mo cluster-binding NifX family protein